MHRRICIFLISLLSIQVSFSPNVWAQENKEKEVKKDTTSLPSEQMLLMNGDGPVLGLEYNVKTPTPNAAALGAYGDIPVSLVSRTPPARAMSIFTMRMAIW